MQDLSYLFSIGFSGSDVARALWIGLVASLIASRKLKPWRVTLVAFALDCIWPFIGMQLAGAAPMAIVQAAIAAILAIPQNAAYYAIRYLGFLAMVYGGFNLRLLLHARAPRDSHAGPYPY